jgi:hypothetical protein
VPTDDITIFYAVEPVTSEIARVALEQRDEIEGILKKPFVSLDTRPTIGPNNDEVVRRTIPVSGDVRRRRNTSLVVLGERRTNRVRHSTKQQSRVDKCRSLPLVVHRIVVRRPFTSRCRIFCHSFCAH